MRHARRNLQRLARLAAIGGLVSGGLMVSSAVASEPSPGAGATAEAAQVVSRLGTSRTAGNWIGADGRPVVAVTDEDAAAEVREAGAKPKVVRYSMDRLRSATEALGEAPKVTGTAWHVDYATNRVVVQADSTVSAADWSSLTGLAERIGGSVQMERTAGTFTTRVNGASPIFAGNSRCSAGFNVTDGQQSFILTAGHCGPVGTTWFVDRQGDAGPLGTTTVSSFPGNDFSLVRYEGGEPFGGAQPDVVEIGEGRGVRITAAADPVVGQRVFRSGSTSGFRSGEVTALNATVNYPEGTVTGLIQTTVCAEPGDSGGPLFAQGLALGVTSGGNGDCTSGGVTYFEPATKALADLGVTLAGSASAAQDGAGAGAQAQVPPPAAAEAGAPGAPGTPASPGGESGSVTVDSIAAGLGPLGALGPGIGVMVASLILLVASRWIQSAQGRRNYRDHYSQLWA
ncbi:MULTISPECIES: S1 family peptidase [unclassified Streptomyces]|uniref:S1 family peptidase n=1 Tax=unclassified Streptomyces TaxID=2593676 RepID=UPI0036668CE9